MSWQINYCTNNASSNHGPFLWQIQSANLEHKRQEHPSTPKVGKLATPRIKISDEGPFVAQGLLPVKGRPTPPPTPRASSRAIPTSQFFDAEHFIEEGNKVEVPPELPKNPVVEGVNKTQMSCQEIWKRALRKPKISDMSLSITQFEEKIAKGRITRCIKLFQCGANKVALALFKDFSNEARRELLDKLQKDEKFGLAGEVEILIAQASLLGREAHAMAVERCRMLFKEEKETEAMLWAATLTLRQRLELIQELLGEKQFKFAVRVTILHGAFAKKDVCSRLMTEKQYDLAVHLACKLSNSEQSYFLEKCQQFIEGGRDDLAIGLSASKLHDTSRYTLCKRLTGKCSSETISQIEHQMKDDTKTESRGYRGHEGSDAPYFFA